MENEGFAQSDVEAVGERMQELTLVRLYLIRLVAQRLVAQIRLAQPHFEARVLFFIFCFNYKSTA